MTGTKTKCKCWCHANTPKRRRLFKKTDWVRLVRCGLCGFVFWNRKHNGRKDGMMLGSWDE